MLSKFLEVHSCIHLFIVQYALPLTDRHEFCKWWTSYTCLPKELVLAVTGEIPKHRFSLKERTMETIIAIMWHSQKAMSQWSILSWQHLVTPCQNLLHIYQCRSVPGILLNVSTQFILMKNLHVSTFVIICLVAACIKNILFVVKFIWQI